MNKRVFFACCIAIGALTTFWPNAHAQSSYPAKPVKVVVPFPAGSSPDLVARFVSQKLTELMGQPFLVDNRAGAAGLHIEDQTFPKRCGHFEGKSVISKEDMLYRLQAALDARTDPDFLIIARTDARGPEGFESAIERAHAYLELGVDAIFVEAPSSLDELHRIGKEFSGTPLVANMIERSRTPLLPEGELLAMGFNIILYANAALYLGSYAIKQGLAVLKKERTTVSLLDRMTSFEERQALVGLDKVDAMERELVDRVKKHISLKSVDLKR
jgi:hypothetical protein